MNKNNFIRGKKRMKSIAAAAGSGLRMRVTMEAFPKSKNLN